MKVLIVGSAVGFSSESAENMMLACRELGDCLARAKHTIVVTSDENDTADRWAVEGAALADGSPQVLVVIPDDDGKAVPFSGQHDDFKKLKFNYRPGQGDRAVGRVRAIKEADAVIALGGADGTIQIGLSAFALGKPVLAIPAFGGGAREVWKIVKPYYTQAGLTHDELGQLSTTWNLDLCVGALTKITKRNPFRSFEYRLRLYMLGVVLMLLFLWAWLFAANYADSFWRNLAVYGMLVIAAFVGTALRLGLSLQPEDSLTRMTSQIVTDLQVAACLAFGFALLYLSGGYVVTGNFISLDKQDDFIRVALTMSLFAFGGAFALDVGVQTLRERIGTFLNKT